MKKVKIILFLLIIVLLSGCRGTYNIKINEDQSINEQLSVNIDNKDGYYELTKSLFEDNKVKKSKYKISPSKETIKINYNETYDSIEDYLLNSKLYRNVFDTINYTKDAKTLYIDTSSVIASSREYSNTMVNNNSIDLLQINIEVPNKVIESNAETVTDNKLSWVITDKTTKKKINFKIDIEHKKAKRNKIIVLSIISLIVISFGVLFYILFSKHRKIN